MNRIARNRAQELPGFADIDDGAVDGHARFDRVQGPLQGFTALPDQLDMARIGQQALWAAVSPCCRASDSMASFNSPMPAPVLAEIERRGSP